jgi:hypothetical protein
MSDWRLRLPLSPHAAGANLHHDLPPVEPTRVRAQLERILASGLFIDAERASRFLRFIVERTLDGRASEIKESVIAIDALSRTPSFDSKTDPSVRIEAGRLRDRLREYYEHSATNGRSGPVPLCRLLGRCPGGRMIRECSRPWRPTTPLSLEALILSRKG